ncbi:MAG: hypothetical protein DMD84_12640 [Candidatus Rokuibacteriota bacterium]|nr:MAG: hypothetical protein DMD84_12640 [Candidatus Rokubacteria bacterium]
MVSRSVLMFLIGGSLAGCRGFAHVSVIVPPLEVNLDVTDVNLQGRPIDVVRPAYYGETEAFLDLVKAPVPVEGVLYDWRRVLVKEGHYIRVLSPQEWRRIGVPVFVPLRPSAEAMRSRTIFVRLNSDGDLYRVSVVGDKAVVKCTSLPHARAKLPSSLSGTPRRPDLANCYRGSRRRSDSTTPRTGPRRLAWPSPDYGDDRRPTSCPFAWRTKSIPRRPD